MSSVLPPIYQMVSCKVWIISFYAMISVAEGSLFGCRRVFPPQRSPKAEVSVFAPKFIRPGHPYTVFLESLTQSDVGFTVSVSGSGINTRSKVKRVAPGSTATLTILTLPQRYRGSKTFTISVIAEDLSKKKKIYQGISSNIKLQSKSLSIFIQTDKAIYQPGQTIKFRGVVVNSELLPFKGKVSYVVQNPKGHVFLKKSDVTLKNGVAGSEFELGRYAVKGKWKISFTVGEYTETISVDVQEYKLPKVEVEIETDQTFIHPGSSRLSGEVKARYTFGQPVKGSGQVEFYYNGSPAQSPHLKISIPEFNGSSKFNVPVEADIWKSKRSWTILARIIEKNTNEEFNATKKVNIYKKQAKVEILFKPNHIKPFLPYVIYMKLSEQDGSLLPKHLMSKYDNDISCAGSFRRTNIWRPMRFSREKKSYLDRSQGEGIHVCNFTNIPADFTDVTFRVKSPNKDIDLPSSWKPTRFKSDANTFLQVTSQTSSASVGDTVTLVITTNRNPTKCNFMFLSQGRIVDTASYIPTNSQPSKGVYRFQYDLKISPAYSPSVYVVVSYVHNNEYIAGTMKITVVGALKNQVTITTSAQKLDAGQPVNITVKAAEGSLVCLRAVDKSVLLLQSGNDITQRKVLDDLDEYGVDSSVTRRNIFMHRLRWRYPWPWWSISASDVGELFEKSGLIVLTNGKIKSTEWGREDLCWPFFHRRAFAAFDTGPGTQRLALASSSFIPQQSRPSQSNRVPPKSTENVDRKEEQEVRNYFPESWIWTEGKLWNNDSITFTFDTPDTITTWELSSFAISNKKGLGVSEKNAEITVFREFFISMNLPPSVVRGETLKLKISLFNYLEESIMVQLTLHDSDQFSILPAGDSINTGSLRTIKIDSQNSAVSTFHIKFNKAGQVVIFAQASAFASSGGQNKQLEDSVERKLLVKPEGVTKFVTLNEAVSRGSDLLDETTVVNFGIELPKDTVPDSKYAKFSVSGNALAETLENLGSLLRMPSGCGEQNMIGLAPDVYISLYLEEINEMTAEIKQKSESHIRAGYQNQLRYQRKDGSFSVWGERDHTGSTWLTAFVLKCLSAAEKLNPELIESSVLQQARSFLLGKQTRDGNFIESGKVYHRELQGGSAKDKSIISAYVVIALQESAAGKSSRGSTSMKTYLEENVPTNDKNVYKLAIVGYALSLLQSPTARKFLAALDSKAIKQNGMLYWSTGTSKGSFQSASASSIETAAYSLLLYNELGNRTEAAKIGKWLIKQRGPHGGYQSTQDTVIAIQALSEISGKASEDDILSVSVLHSEVDDFQAKFNVTRDNFIVQQMVELPDLSGIVTAKVEGVGECTMQVSYRYNVPPGLRPSDPFIIDITMDKISQSNVKVQICSRINHNSTNPVTTTGMYTVSFQLPSGFTVDDAVATKDSPDAKFVELVGEEVAGYFDEVPVRGSVCMNLVFIQYEEVSPVMPKLVVGFDYYKPDIRAQVMLDLNAAVVCSSCQDDCEHCPP